MESQIIDGSSARDYTYVSDIVAANLLAMRYDGEKTIFNIGGGSRASVNSVLDLVGRHAKGEFDVRYKAGEKGDVKHTYADTSLARTELSFEPNTTLEHGIEMQAEWMKEILTLPPID